MTAFGVEVLQTFQSVLHRRRVALGETGLMPIWVGFRRFAGGIEPRDLLRRQIPADGAEIVLELLFITRSDDDA